MIPHPLKLLLVGYGLATLLAGAMMAAGAGLLTIGLLIWLVGPAVVFALGMIPGIRERFGRSAEPEGENAADKAIWIAKEEELRAWDADLARELEDQRKANLARRADRTG